jgi:hypothetical protein
VYRVSQRKKTPSCRRNTQRQGVYAALGVDKGPEYINRGWFITYKKHTTAAGDINFDFPITVEKPMPAIRPSDICTKESTPLEEGETYPFGIVA